MKINILLQTHNKQALTIIDLKKKLQAYERKIQRLEQVNLLSPSSTILDGVGGLQPIENDLGNLSVLNQTQLSIGGLSSMQISADTSMAEDMIEMEKQKLTL